MSYTKRLLFSWLVCLIALAARASNEPSQLVVAMNDGTETVFILSNQPTITFDTNKVYINSSEFSATLSDVREFYFKTESSPATSIGSVKEKSESTFTVKYVDGHTAYLYGCSANTKIEVYSLNGAKAPASIEHSGTTAVVRLDQLRSGVYIIRANSQSFKIYKR